jgi:hypothetical protein
MSKFASREAMREHMNAGHSVSLLEAMLLFGVQSPNAEFYKMKKDGYLLGHQRVPMAKVLSRLNQYVNCDAPKELPQREILMSEYWVKK